MSAVPGQRVSERLFDLADGWSPFRYSAPVVAICTREMLGIVTTQVGALRAGSLVHALAQLHANRTALPPVDSAPRLTDQLSDAERAALMGGTLQRIYGWSPGT